MHSKKSLFHYIFDSRHYRRKTKDVKRKVERDRGEHGFDLSGILVELNYLMSIVIVCSVSHSSTG